MLMSKNVFFLKLLTCWEHVGSRYRYVGWWCVWFLIRKLVIFLSWRRPLWVLISRKAMLSRCLLVSEPAITYTYSADFQWRCENIIYSLHSYAFSLSSPPALLQSLLQVEHIKQHFKSKLVGMVLSGYLSLRRWLRAQRSVLFSLLRFCNMHVPC